MGAAAAGIHQQQCWALGKGDGAKGAQQLSGVWQQPHGMVPEGIPSASSTLVNEGEAAGPEAALGWGELSLEDQ